MLAKLKRVAPSPNGRLIAISDVHGHRALFDELLEKLCLTPADTLIIVGDICERGEDTLGMIRRAMQLCKGGRAHMCIGNNELWTLSYLTGEMNHSARDAYEYARGMTARHGSSLFVEMCRELGIAFGPEMDAEAARRECLRCFAPEIDFLMDLPTFIDTPEYLFVHGGMPSGDEERYVGMEVHPFLKNDAFIEKGVCFEKYLIVGHWPSGLYRADKADYSPYISRRQRIVDIDGGVGLKFDAQLNALLLPRGGDDFSWMSVDGIAPSYALDAQAPSRDPVHVRWGHGDVDVLAERGDIALVRHVETGRELYAPVSLLYDRSPGSARCQLDGLSSYELEVRPGDELHVLLSTSRGYLAKKGSVTGWYRGRVAQRAPEINPSARKCD